MLEYEAKKESVDNNTLIDKRAKIIGYSYLLVYLIYLLLALVLTGIDSTLTDDPYHCPSSVTDVINSVYSFQSIVYQFLLWLAIAASLLMTIVKIVRRKKKNEWIHILFVFINPVTLVLIYAFMFLAVLIAEPVEWLPAGAVTC